MGPSKGGGDVKFVFDLLQSGERDCGRERINYAFLANFYRIGIIDYCEGIILRPLGLGAKNAGPA